eukprot:3550534-Pyramimonas_sp.AAC.1
MIGTAGGASELSNALISSASRSQGNCAHHLAVDNDLWRRRVQRASLLGGTGFAFTAGSSRKVTASHATVRCEG